MKMVRNEMIIGVLGLISGILVGFLITINPKLNKLLVGNQHSGKAIEVLKETHFEKLSFSVKPAKIQIEIPRTAIFSERRTALRQASK